MKTVGIIGINGMVGQNMLAELKKIQTPFEIKTFGRNDEITPLDIAVLCTDNPVSRQLAPQIKDRVKFTVDMSSEFRMTEGVPLVIPEINPHVIAKDTPLIASPNCTTTGLVMSLAPLKPFYHFTEAFFCSYQAISGGGKKLLDDFHTPGSLYEKNCVPLIGSILDNGHTSEELKGLYETRKIMELPDIKVYCHTVRVGVENSHSLGVTLKAKEEFDLEQVKKLWRSFPNLTYSDSVVTPKEVSGKETTFICRLRKDVEDPKIIHYFVTFDNLLKGAAMNGRQIVELLLEKYV
ncbi:MAG: Asd/ArgC dimerization domain-containing protein [Candidatus Avelusimicrobium sp.]|uniref:aspartate-semialdehyde dehydrogenase n=1 Tax=Candidatus Avelusimicrobium sp. TaxID=3048833 RepID=UPI003F0FF36B